MTRATHTYAELEVSPEAYDEIAAKLKVAGYGHAFMDDGAIDMHGIGLVKARQPEEGAVRAIVPERVYRHGLVHVLKTDGF